ncbi:uncharacterized protein MONBRDRAFT_9468 [Monosiga brevicollis MX1]|uniref:Uncharacterized protein n=1 Tax=Monosiga brevicollis TaxID=81824 RepID=A9V389_MONBE|nr:uncharacterized protein MONBRDRAFT_9468 [Monosiga brevicollis MX1]EDQ88147.1 predicted protein [Monosiga brevicollis MX1]|eukprot:XP_001747223.1 hypothetical protein [Monosiga brevicollis MX1]
MSLVVLEVNDVLGPVLLPSTSRDEAEQILDEIVALRVYPLDHLKGAVRVVDAGAHVGLFTRYILKHRDQFDRLDLLVVEPNPALMALVQLNISLILGTPNGHGLCESAIGADTEATSTEGMADALVWNLPNLRVTAVSVALADTVGRATLTCHRETGPAEGALASFAPAAQNCWAKTMAAAAATLSLLEDAPVNPLYAAQVEAEILAAAERDLDLLLSQLTALGVSADDAKASLIEALQGGLALDSPAMTEPEHVEVPTCPLSRLMAALGWSALDTTWTSLLKVYAETLAEGELRTLLEQLGHSVHVHRVQPAISDTGRLHFVPSSLGMCLVYGQVSATL